MRSDFWTAGRGFLGLDFGFLGGGEFVVEAVDIAYEAVEALTLDEFEGREEGPEAD